MSFTFLNRLAALVLVWVLTGGDVVATLVAVVAWLAFDRWRLRRVLGRMRAARARAGDARDRVRFEADDDAADVDAATGEVR